MLRPMQERPVVTLNLDQTPNKSHLIIVAFRKAARQCGWYKEEIDEVVAEAKSKDYAYLLQTILKQTTQEGGLT